MNMILKSALLLTVAASLSACERARAVTGGESHIEDGIRFKPRVQAEKDDRASFVVTVRGANRSIEGAKEAARVGGIRHCIKHYGNSDITWNGASPDDENIALGGADLTLSGRCSTW